MGRRPPSVKKREEDKGVYFVPFWNLPLLFSRHLTFVIRFRPPGGAPLKLVIEHTERGTVA